MLNHKGLAKDHLGQVLSQTLFTEVCNMLSIPRYCF